MYEDTWEVSMHGSRLLGLRLLNPTTTCQVSPIAADGPGISKQAADLGELSMAAMAGHAGQCHW